jgi:2-polyprenyl-3-methyl-5-hydroxy-6-metoxy-1,4-benzoquinol methylase
MIEKRIPEMQIEDIQSGNQSWWTENTMSYDWNDKVEYQKFSLPWYNEVDMRFIHSARLFATNKIPFDNIIPFEEIAGKRVLEIGCGVGFHSELMVRAGANLSAIDLSPTSVEATTNRFSLKNLQGNIQQADAEHIPFPDQSFDFVWSWGVIHHSARTARIVREISRVLKPGGECRIMVYNRLGVLVPITFFTNHLLKGKFLNQDFDQTLLASSDGFSARFYTPDQFSDLFYAFFKDVNTEILGQDSDSLPFPARIRNFAIKFIPNSWLRKRQSKAGAFLFLKARNPISPTH